MNLPSHALSHSNHNNNNYNSIQSPATQRPNQSLSQSITSSLTSTSASTAVLSSLQQQQQQQQHSFPAHDLLFINFNQDFSCLSVGTRHGYKIFNCDPFGRCFARSDGGYRVVEMLFCTSLVALVGAGEQPTLSPRRLQITNTKRQSTICELNFVTGILAVKLNRKRLIVVLEEHIHVYDISNMKILHTIDTAPNPSAICSLSPSSDRCYLSYPANTSTGEVLIFDAIQLQTVNILQAHKNPLSQITFNSDGSLLATSSDKGTVVRIFSVPECKRLYQFRRGSMPTRIYSLTFNLLSTLLCVTSASDTVHIFKLSPSLSASTTSLVGSYLPEMISEMWEPVRDFAFLKLPSSGLQSIAALSSSSPHVLVVTSEGYMLQYSIDLENGGECVLLKQYSLLDSGDRVITTPLPDSADDSDLVTGQ